MVLVVEGRGSQNVRTVLQLLNLKCLVVMKSLNLFFLGGRRTEVGATR